MNHEANQPDDEPITLTLQYPVVTIKSEQPSQIGPLWVGLIVVVIIACLLLICERKFR